MVNQVIVVGGGLSGLSAAHTVLENGGKVIMVERNAFMGGNSTKATSGINGAGTKTQKNLSIPDSVQIFEQDTIRGATGIKTGPCPPSYPLAKVISHNSTSAVHWLQENFGLALDTVSRLGGHSHPRTHRSLSGGKFPGMEITYALMQRLENIAEKEPSRAQIITKSRVTKILTDASGKVTGVEYTKKGGEKGSVHGSAVVIASGGYGAVGLTKGSILERVRPELMHLPTTNGDHCDGSGISAVMDIGGSAIDLMHVQVHPTGLVNPKDPDNQVKFLAAEALRGEGGILLDKDGKRFVNELQTRDFVSSAMWKHGKGPYRLILNHKSSANIAWHCKHYVGRGVMKEYKSGRDLAKDMGVDAQNLVNTFNDYNKYSKEGGDPFLKPQKFFKGVPVSVDDSFHVAHVCPIVHYTMGGVEIDANSQCVNTDKQPIAGLFAAGEVTGGVHGKNRLGGSALLECVVFGRVAGASAFDHMKNGPKGAVSGTRGANTNYNVSNLGKVSTDPAIVPKPTKKVKKVEEAAAPVAEIVKGGTYSLEQVAKHNKENDCWVVVNGEVLNVTEFMHDHPGGKMAIMTFAGRDATEEFNMVHEDGVVQKYAAETVIGTLAPKSKL